MSTGMKRFAWALTFGAVAAAASAGDVKVIYTEVATDPSSIVPGAKDAAGNPVETRWLAIEEVVLRHDGGQWVIKGRSTLASTLDAILILGSGFSGNAFCQDGQPFQGGVSGELYDFFDTPIPASWDDNGNIAFSARAKGGSAAVFEKVVVFDGSTHTIVHQMGDPALGLIDNPPGSSGDELFGNSINSVYLRNDGLVGFVNTPITNCHSSRYPAYFIGNTSFKQSGISTIDGETWDSFGLSDAGGTPDGAHWFAEGDTENPDTSIDGILAVDDAVAIREGSPVAGSSVICADIFFTRMLSDGTWFSRGDDPSDNDWAARSGVLLAKTGDPIGASGENWGASFSAFTGNRVGDWLLAGNTNNADPNVDSVLVLNGTDVVLREGDPIDVNGDGTFNDDAHLASFQPNDLHLTDSREVYFLATLRNGAGTSIGDAFLYLSLAAQPCAPCDTNCDGSVNGQDIANFVAALSGSPDPCSPCNSDTNGDGSVNGMDISGFIDCLTP